MSSLAIRKSATPLRALDFSPQKRSKSLNFCYLSKNLDLISLVKDALGKSGLDKILDEKSWSCEILKRNYETTHGLIVYKNKTKNVEMLKNCFVVKQFLPINSKEYPLKDVPTILLNRIIKLANRNFAQNVIVNIPAQSNLVEFFKTEEFQIIKKSHKEKAEDEEEHLMYLSLKSERTSSQDHTPLFSHKKEEAKKDLVSTNSLEKLFSANESLSPPLEETPKHHPEDSFSSANPSRKRAFIPSESNLSANPLKRLRTEEKNEPSFRNEEKSISSLVLNKSVSEGNLRNISYGGQAMSRNTFSRPKIHNLPMKGTIYFDYIMSGEKKFEGRVGGHTCQIMQVGDELKLFDSRARWGIICKIVSKDTYPSFRSMLSDKGVLPMLPQLKSLAGKISQNQLLDEGIKIYEGFPGSHRVRQFGAVAIGVEFIKKIY